MVAKKKDEQQKNLIPPDLDLGTNKAFFKIGEVAEIVGVAAYVLRYWESEFPSVSPQKSKSQQRVYRRSDVEQLLRIKHLLYDQKFTIAGAKQLLESRSEGATVQCAEVQDGYVLRQTLANVRQEFALLCQLVRDDGQFDEKAADPATYLRSRDLEDPDSAWE